MTLMTCFNLKFIISPAGSFFHTKWHWIVKKFAKTLDLPPRGKG